MNSDIVVGVVIFALVGLCSIWVLARLKKDSPPLHLFDLFTPLLKLFTYRSVVRRADAPYNLIYLRESLAERGFPYLEKFTDPIATSILEETFRRAAEKERDGLPRFGRFITEVDHSVESILAICGGDIDADDRLRTILLFHHVI